MATLGDVVRSLRETADLSQEELAAKAGVSRATIQNLENDRRQPRRASLRRIADALGTTPLQLVERELADVDLAVRPTQVVVDTNVLIDALRAENAELRAQVKEVEELRSELLELRDEIDRLRKVRKPDAKSG